MCCFLKKNGPGAIPRHSSAGSSAGSEAGMQICHPQRPPWDSSICKILVKYCLVLDSCDLKRVPFLKQTYLHTYAHTYTHTHVHIYIYRHTHTCTYIYIYTCACCISCLNQRPNAIARYQEYHGQVGCFRCRMGTAGETPGSSAGQAAQLKVTWEVSGGYFHLGGKRQIFC